jgi:chromosome segregation ATPase
MKLAEDRLREATARLSEAEGQLAHVEERREALAGEAAIARRAIADFEQLLEELRGELAELHVQEAHQAFDKLVEARDLALGEAASALDWIRTALDELDTRRAAVAQGLSELRAVDPDVSTSVPSEPDVLDNAWERIIPVLRTRLDQRLEIDLVEAAAASHVESAIEELPQHLRELARQRRTQRIREAWLRQRS